MELGVDVIIISRLLWLVCWEWMCWDGFGDDVCSIL